VTALLGADEAALARALAAHAAFEPPAREAVCALATALVEQLRASAFRRSAVESLLQELDLSSPQGLALLSLAEALLRVPDSATADRLIAEKLSQASRSPRARRPSGSLAVRAVLLGLELAADLVASRGGKSQPAVRATARALAPALRLALRSAMRALGRHFVFGRTIEEALARSREPEHRTFRHSFDMLGEAALSAAEARRHFERYRDAIRVLGAAGPWPDPLAAPSVSVKLSALHPRFEHAQRARVMAELVPALSALARDARAAGLALAVDAEESDRMELALDVLEALCADRALAGWNGLGIAVQAYQKRAFAAIDWLAELARASGRRLCVRLVKGAYWDTEIKRAQVEGHVAYPVFTRKVATDVSYLACARRLFEHGEVFHPQFATHNAHSFAAVYELARGRRFEYQRLHGMGRDLYRCLPGLVALDVPCRVYAPVGSHEELLPYLVRRLLENGANTSFVHRIADPALAVAELAADPVEALRALDSIPHSRIAPPARLFGDERRNSMGVNLANDAELAALAEAVNAARGPWEARPLVPGWEGGGEPLAVTDPADRRRLVGRWVGADEGALAIALANAARAQPDWDRVPAAERAAMLERAAESLEARRGEFVALLVREAGKTIPDSLAEVREAVDFLRYYAAEGRRSFGAPLALPSPTGESNELHLRGRGVFAAISPWNFPLSIFTGQVAAALMAGNSVLAKPAEQTPLVAYRATTLLHEAGVPPTVLQLLPGDGERVGAALVRDRRVAGVVFTGSTETARAIHRALAAREGPIATLVAETGGQNAIVADSSAFPEQLVKDAIASAFNSAGQRCSAARLLFVQEEIADRVLELLAGAMAELVIGDPGELSTDIGPLIDEPARRALAAHAARMDREARPIRVLEPGPACAHGTFFGPRAYEIGSPAQLEREVFGPILHVVRWKAGELDRVVDAINATGYGLTLGIHSRVDATVERVFARARVGNVYVNRSIVGAVVGVQPFGGEGLSGTGPKAGGPYYLPRLAVERTLTVNTAATGGNARLLAIGS